MPALVKTPETTYRIHAQDCDHLGQLRNARYFDYFLNAREDHTTEHYDLNIGQLARDQQAAWVITKHQISFLKPARQGVMVRILSQLVHYDNSSLVLEMQMRSEDGSRLLALLWSEMAYITTTGGTRTDHSDAMMDFLEKLDVDVVSYDPDGFDERVKEVHQQLKKQHR